MSAVESLMEMGFPRNRAEKALAVTGNKGVQPAMDWLFAHSDDPDIDDPYDLEATGHKLGSAPTDEPTGPAKSLKCDDCGKLLRSEMEVQAHAARTQHSNFSESTEEIRPMTAEEKAAQLEKLEERIKQKRVEKQDLERKETQEREKQRRKTGKELSDIKHQMELQEAKKIAEEKRREKVEERLARQKVRDEIAKDRAERASRDKSTLQAAQPKAIPTPTKKEYDTCRLQIRLFGGGALVHSFKATDTLVEVNQHVLMHQPSPNLPFTLMTTFPKRVFSDIDTKKTLKELGLVPSSVLIQTQPPL